MAIPTTKQTNIVANEARSLIFFEGEEYCYNWKTGQWSQIPGYDGLGFIGLRGSEGENSDIALVVYSGNAVDLQTQTTSDPALSAELETGYLDLNEGGRAVVEGVRPLVNGGTVTVRVGQKDYPGDTTTYSTSTAINTRTRYANFRKEGRYLNTEVTITGGFNQAFAADVEWNPQGDV